MTTELPVPRLTVVTCMDYRIDPLAHLGLAPGEAFVLRVPGGRVTEPVLGALILAVHTAGVDSVWVVHHTDCRLQVGDEQLRQRLGGAGSGYVFPTFDDPEVALAEDAKAIRDEPSLAGRLSNIRTMRLDVETGRLSEHS